MANFTTPTESRVNNARIALLAILFFSVLNVFTIVFFQATYVFSAYLPRDFLAIAVITNDPLFIAQTVALALFALLPYAVCWYYSKKNVVWMMIALGLFAVDSLFFFINLPAFFTDDVVYCIMDVIVRCYGLLMLGVGVVYGLKKKKEDAQRAEMEREMGSTDMPIPDVGREITIIRQRALFWNIVPMVVYVNRKEIGSLKNGETQTFTVPSHAFELGVSFSNGAAGTSIEIAEGDEKLRYHTTLKMNVTSHELILTPIE